MKVLDDAARAAVRSAIAAHQAQLAALPGYVAAEPGFPLVDGRFLREPAVIVLVDRKRPVSEVPVAERAPRQLGPYRVCVMQADPARQLAASADFEDTANASCLRERAAAPASRHRGRRGTGRAASRCRSCRWAGLQAACRRG